MQKTITLLDINLRLFDGAAGGAGAAGSAGDGGAPGAGAQQEGTGALPKAESRRSGSSRRSRSGAFDNVVFGKQDAAQTGAASPAAGENMGEGNAKLSAVQTTSDTKEAKRQAFKDLIEGEYKDQYTEMFQTAFDRRFKESKAMEQSLNAQKPIIDMLAMRYGITDGDPAKLQTAIEQDEAYWEAAAEEAGLTTPQLMERMKKDLAMQKLQAEHKELKRMQSEEKAQQKLREWHEAGEKLKAIYPSFDFKTEMQSQDFRGLLASGVSVQKAYETMHMAEINAAAAKAAAQTAGQQMVANLQKKAARPQENGTSSQSAVITKSDVHSLTRKERAEAARRAERGYVQKF